MQKLVRITIYLMTAVSLIVFPWRAVYAVGTQYEAAGFDFLQNSLLDPSGGIYANYLTVYPNDPDAGVNHQMLSEYAGIAMEYAVYANKQDFFSSQDNFVTTYLQNHPDQPCLKLYNWRINAALDSPAASSATIDDFRIVDGYLQAAKKWGNDEYRTAAVAAAADIKNYTMVNGIISEAGSWDADGVYSSNRAILSYFDLPAMQRLSETDAAWTAIEQAHYDLLAESAAELGNNGLFWLQYDIDANAFIEQDSLDTIHEAMILEHLAEAGHMELAQTGLDFYKTEFAATGGRIYGAYTPNGEADSPYEDISIYSILASAALFLSDQEFADDLFEKITSLQVAGTDSIYGGAFLWCADGSDCNNDRVYAFVQLQALRALAQANPVAYVAEDPAPTPEPTPDPDPAPTPEPEPEPDLEPISPPDDPSEDPVVEEPAPNDDPIEDPVVEEPAPQENPVEDPAVEEPAPSDPVEVPVEDPEIEEPLPDDDPVTEEPAPDEDPVEDPVDDPVDNPTDDPITEEPIPDLTPTPDAVTIRKARYNNRTHWLIVRVCSTSAGQAEMRVAKIGKMKYIPGKEYYQLVKKIKRQKLPKKIKVISSWNGTDSKKIKVVSRLSSK